MSAKELSPCGTKAARRRHYKRGEECATCGPRSRVKYQCGTHQARRRHARNNETCETCDNTKVDGRKKNLAPCGTQAARQRHYKHGEKCEACKPAPPTLAPCGTKTARDRHNRRNETCQTCDDAKTLRAQTRALAPCGTKQARQRHNRAGVTCETCNNKPRHTPPLKPCGTVAAAKRHRAHGEPLCEPCRVAQVEYDTKRRRANGVKARTNTAVEDLVEEVRFLVNAGEGTHRILQATGYLGREKSLRTRLTQAGHHHLAQQALNPWDLAA